MTWGFTALAAATIYTGNKQSKAATSAADTQAAAAVQSGAISKEVADKQLALQKEQFDTSTAVQKQQFADVMALQKQQYAEEVARQAPWLTAGTNALAEMQDKSKWALPAAFNPNDPAYAQPGAFTFTNQDFQTDPGYAFRLNEGLKSLERSAAARGGLLSGGTGKALQAYGQDMASQEYQNAYNRAFTGYNTKVQQADTGFNRALTGYNAAVNRAETGYNRLAGLAGVGQAASGQLNQLSQNYVNNATNTSQNYANNLTATGQNYANSANAALGGYGTNASNALLNAANARASGYVGSANALTSALGTGLNFYTQQQYINRLPIPTGR